MPGSGDRKGGACVNPTGRTGGGGIMVIPYSHNTPEEILARCSSGEITPEDAITVLEIRRNYYGHVSGGGAADRNYPITPEEAEEKIGAVKNAIETLRAILYPAEPEFIIELAGTRNRLREIRDGCITGGYTKKAALALFDQTWLDFTNDTIFKANKFCEDIAERPVVIDSQIRQMLDEDKVMDIINGIRAEIEGIPEPSPPQPQTETPERKTAEGLPPVIQAVWDEGLLDTPVNGKYPKKGDKKDKDIIEWIFDYSGYKASLTTELYMQYIQTQCKPTTIQDYITRNRKIADE
jgi:hypothetical protein